MRHNTILLERESVHPSFLLLDCKLLGNGQVSDVIKFWMKKCGLVIWLMIGCKTEPIYLKHLYHSWMVYPLVVYLWKPSPKHLQNVTRDLTWGAANHIELSILAWSCLFTMPVLFLLSYEVGHHFRFVNLFIKSVCVCVCARACMCVCVCVSFPNAWPVWCLNSLSSFRDTLYRALSARILALWYWRVTHILIFMLSCKEECIVLDSHSGAFQGS
jgi:hypothetical protein